MFLSELKNSIPELNVSRDGEFKLTSNLGFSKTNGTLSFLREQRYLSILSDEISCIVTTEELRPLLPECIGVVISDNPRGTFAQIHNTTAEKQIYSFSNKTYNTIIGENCIIHESAIIAEKNVIIGNNTTIGPNVVIMEDVTIGNESSILSGVVIGDDGFEYCFCNDKNIRLKHLGRVKIGNNVSIHSNSCVLKALFADDCTTIGDNAIIDCFVHVGHGVKIGYGATIVAGTSLGGAVIIEEKAFLGINSSVKQLQTVGKGSLVGMGAVVIKSVDANQLVLGNPARVIKDGLQFVKGSV